MGAGPPVFVETLCEVAPYESSHEVLQALASVRNTDTTGNISRRRQFLVLSLHRINFGHVVVRTVNTIQLVAE